VPPEIEIIKICMSELVVLFYLSNKGKKVAAATAALPAQDK
jgi:hypothetical protein